jgi:hypothetical protein
MTGVSYWLGKNRLPSIDRASAEHRTKKPPDHPTEEPRSAHKMAPCFVRLVESASDCPADARIPKPLKLNEKKSAKGAYK